MYSPHPFTPEGSAGKCHWCKGADASAPNHTKSSLLREMGMNPGPKSSDLVISLADPSPVDDLLIKHLPHMVALFRSKARDYSSDNSFTADVLGARGQFAEIWRKVGKLKRSMWDGRTMEFEQTEEILEDLFGHIMLAIDYSTVEKKVDKYRGLK